MEVSTSEKKGSKHGRWKYVIDARMQFSVLYMVLGVLALTSFAFIGAAVTLPESDALVGLTPTEVSTLTIQIAAVYFLFSFASLTWITLVLTHRVAGPAFVLERAVREMDRGNFESRTRLRKKDYLKSLSEALTEHASTLREERAMRLESLDRILESVRAGDVAVAESLLKSLAARDRTPETTSTPAANVPVS